MDKCSIEHCDRDAKTKGYCGKHYQSLNKYGDPLYTEKKSDPKNRYTYKIKGDVTEIYFKQRNGKEHTTYISTSDLQKFLDFKYKWHVCYYYLLDDYYVRANQYLGTFDGKPKYKPVLLHKYLTGIEGRTVVDHINGNQLDNRQENLRKSTVSKNAMNRKGANKNSKSGERNVAWVSSEKKWVVQLSIDGKNTRLGKFEEHELEEAKQFARQKRKEIYGEEYV